MIPVLDFGLTRKYNGPPSTGQMEARLCEAIIDDLARSVDSLLITAFVGSAICLVLVLLIFKKVRWPSKAGELQPFPFSLFLDNTSLIRVGGKTTHWSAPEPVSLPHFWTERDLRRSASYTKRSSAAFPMPYYCSRTLTHFTSRAHTA